MSNKYNLHAQVLNQITRGKEAIVQMLNRTTSASLERCFNQKRPEEGFALLRLVRYARKFALGSTYITELETKLRKCLTFKLSFHSIITETAPGYGYYYELHAELTLKATTGMRATGNGPLNYMDVHWTAGGSCTFTAGGQGSTFEVQNPDFGLTITPVSRTSPAVNITLQYDPGLPSEQVTMQCPQVPPLTWSTNAWYYYFDKMHFSERLLTSGYRVTSQFIGAGAFPGWTYHQTAPGPDNQAGVEDTVIKIEHTPQK